MRVIITGGIGLIGMALTTLLVAQQHEVIIVSRDQRHAAQLLSHRGVTNAQTAPWDGASAQGWGHLITPTAALINLAGANPAHWRWTPAYRRLIRDSRLRAGMAVRDAITRYGAPAVLVQASASGYYGDCGDDIITELRPPGTGFRADVCQEWEMSTADLGMRRCVARTGIVLANDAGAFPPLRLFARLLGRQLGSGQQWIPWVHIDDVAAALLALLTRAEFAGTFNLCAPAPATNRDFIHTIQRVSKLPGIFPLPALALRLCLGEMASVVLASQRMMPRRLLASNFRFIYPDLSSALRQLLCE